MSASGSGTPAGSIPLGGPGGHAGHQVHPHSHQGQDPEWRSAADWCSGRWLCLSCTSEDLPQGTWFAGPKCAKPRSAVRESGR